MTTAALLLALSVSAPDVPEGSLPDVRPSDVFRFPPAGVLRQRVRFAERHLAWLDARAAALGPGWAAREYDYRQGLVRRRDVWKLALDAAEADCAECRGAYLASLRRRLGVAAYNRGELPELPEVRAFMRAD